MQKSSKSVCATVGWPRHRCISQPACPCLLPSTTPLLHTAHTRPHLQLAGLLEKSTWKCSTAHPGRHAPVTRHSLLELTLAVDLSGPADSASSRSVNLRSGSCRLVQSASLSPPPISPLPLYSPPLRWGTADAEIKPPSPPPPPSYLELSKPFSVKT